ncbi:MAG: TIGR01212 family radical SAM protein [Tissierellia bacterium]|nr:TIGR01212 family radical SAM protein [Tissierellia bacterium]
METPYREYSKFLRERFGEKVYKIPIKLNLTCPNRDGSCGVGGCIFCGEQGGSFENLDATLSVRQQLIINKEYIGKRYGAKKFISYFQNFTNTYQPLDNYKKALKDAIDDDVVGITISTRPDYLQGKYLEATKPYLNKYLVTFELGIQSVNYKTLRIIGRGHGLAQSIDGILKLKSMGFRVCVHMILDLPWDTKEDIIEGARILNVLKVDEVKIHSLYVVKDTFLEHEYKNHRFKPLSQKEYINRVITFLEYLSPDIVVQRLIGRAPEDETVFCNWGQSWWKIRDEIVETMQNEHRYQGKLYEIYNKVEKG